MTDIENDWNFWDELIGEIDTDRYMNCEIHDDIVIELAQALNNRYYNNTRKDQMNIVQNRKERYENLCFIPQHCNKPIPSASANWDNEKNIRLHNLLIQEADICSKGVNIIMNNYIFQDIRFYIYLSNIKRREYTDIYGSHRLELEIECTCVYLKKLNFKVYQSRIQLRPFITTNILEHQYMCTMEDNHKELSTSMNDFDEGETYEVAKFLECMINHNIETYTDVIDFMYKWSKDRHTMLSIKLVELAKLISIEKKRIICEIQKICKCKRQKQTKFRCSCYLVGQLVRENDDRFDNILF